MIRRLGPLLALIIVTNVVMLLSARANRAGEPEAVLTVTERELKVEPTSDRDSAVTLRLDIVTDDDLIGTWLTPEKVASLGFGCPPPKPGAPYATASCGLPRRVFVAVEFDGPAWNHLIEIQRARRAKGTPPTRDDEAEWLDWMMKTRSRLVAADASLDADALRAAHPDRGRNLIVEMTMNLYVCERCRPDRSTGSSVYSSMTPVTSVVVVPQPLREMFIRLRQTADRNSVSNFGVSYGAVGPAPEPRYTVSLALGRHYEPWIASASRLATAGR